MYLFNEHHYTKFYDGKSKTKAVAGYPKATKIGWDVNGFKLGRIESDAAVYSAK
jgi:hypothetical protein